MAVNYSNRDIFNLFMIYGECNRIIARTCRTFNERYPHLPDINPSKFRRIQSNFMQYGSIKAKISKNKIVTDNEENIINVLAYFRVNPHGSIQSACNDLGISCTSICRILKAFQMHDYSINRVQALNQEDPIHRRIFCETILIKIQEDPFFLQKIIWTDESKFGREGIFNRKNLHYWNDVNPHYRTERNFQNKFSVNVFCLMMDNQIRFHIYEDNLNSAKYLDILRHTVSDFLDDLPLNLFMSCWYVMDGAPAHCTAQVHEKVSELFEDRWFGRYGPWRWPPRSPDLSPLDFYLWGYIKSKVYATPILTKEELLRKIRTAFAELDPSEIRRATTRSLPSRIEKCLNQHGGHFEH